MDKNQLEQALSELPLYTYFYADPQKIEFSDRIRYICSTECPMYNRTWACPPAVGEVASCKEKCLGYKKCLVIGTIVEVNDISDIEEGLATRGDHERITREILQIVKEQSGETLTLSTEACAICERCAYLDGQPCRFPEKMHPCVESHGINVLGLLEDLGLSFQYGENVVTWFSLLFYND